MARIPDAEVQRLKDLGGYSSNVGLNAGFGFGGTIDTFGGRGANGQRVGGVGVTLGGGFGVQGYGAQGYTSVSVFGNGGCKSK